jgi:membrane fusion protein, multidrug efflux system
MKTPINKNTYMKYNYTRTIAVTLVSGILLLACGKKEVNKHEALDKLKTEQEKLKAERSKLTDKINALQAEIVKASGGEETARAKEINVTAVATRTFEHTVQTQGNIESLENIQVSAKTPGIVTQVYGVEGESVNAGQVIGQVDNSLMIRGMDELRARLDLAKTVFDRQKNLWDQKIGTEVQYLQAKSNKESLERNLASLNEQNENTKIKSPITGIIDEVQMRVGQNIAPGMPAARVINNENLKVKANVSEAYVSMIKKGNKVTVTIPDLKKDIVATVTFVGRNINPLSRTFAVEVKLPSSADLRPNMSVVIKVVFESVPNAVVVPVNVVQDINGEKIIYIAEKNGNKTVAKRKVVKVGGVYNNLAQVTSGLATGDQVITTGYQGLNDGELVKI